VAVARALLHRPPILLADEPTAALDWHNGEAAVRLLVEQAKTEGSLLLTVTHDARLLPLFDRRLHMREGRLEEGVIEESQI
jgi:putative ABC transport system ATP-binding protein